MRVATDTGGTFTDFVAWTDDARRVVLKVPSTPDDPARAVGEGLRQLAPEPPSGEHRHGSTVATNALLERKGGRVVLVTNEGFEDLLVIGRQARERLYDPDPSRPPPLVPAECRLGIRQRQDASGVESTRPTDDEIGSLARRVAALAPTAVAVGLLHSYRDPEPERRIARAVSDLLGPSVPVTCSADLVPEAREYERIQTACLNAYLRPVMERYLGRLEEVSRPLALRVMQSSGGLVDAARARVEPVRTLLSGPAGGVVGAARWAARCGYREALAIDVGGTSTDVSLIAGAPRWVPEGAVAGLPVRIPMIEVHSIGAGGGSIIGLDAGGALRVGPQSAGAVPGPACYGQGGAEPTITDALLFLGRIPPAGLLGGALPLLDASARKALARKAREAGLSTEALALGAVEVAEARMERALRVMSTERGHDPARCALVAFGGAGPLHAASLARRLGIPAVVVPPDPGVLSAQGILESDLRIDRAETILRPLDEVTDIAARSRALASSAGAALAAQGASPADIACEVALDLRYRGQSYELAIPWREGEDARGAFESAHEEQYGYRDPARPVELVCLRVTGIGRSRIPEPPSNPPGPEDAAPARSGDTWLIIGPGEGERAPIYDRPLLRSGMGFSGPALVAEYSATTYVPPGWGAAVTAHGALLLGLRGA